MTSPNIGLESQVAGEEVEKSITVFGTSHRVQGARKAAHLQHINDASYGRYLESQLRVNRFDFVFEEATGFGPTIAEDLATKFLGEGHYLNVDPPLKDRAKFGIPMLREDHTPIDPYGNEGFVGHQDLEGQAMREELWVKRCKEQTFTCALFICGFLHTLSLSFRLQAAGFSVERASTYMPYDKLGATKVSKAKVLVKPGDDTP